MTAIVFCFYSQTGTWSKHKMKAHRKLMQQSFSTEFQNVYLFREKKKREKEKEATFQISADQALQKQQIFTFKK